MTTFPTTLDDYLSLYGTTLAQQAQQRSKPLHTPGKDATVDLSHLLRPPLEAQRHVVTAICRAWEHEKGIMVSAEMGCIAGESQVYDPVAKTYRTVDQIDAPFHVLAWDRGNVVIAQALAPFVAGRRALYQVDLSDGSCFVATGNHLVLTTSGWTFVANLASSAVLSFSQSLLDSTSDASQQVCRQGDAHWSDRRSDSHDRYSQDRRRCDEQPHRELGIGRELVLQQGGVRGHSQHCSQTGVLESTSADSLAYRRDGLLSMQDCLPHSFGIHEIASLLRASEALYVQDGSRAQGERQCPSATRQIRTIPSSARSAIEFEVSPFYAPVSIGRSSDFVHVTAIRYLREDWYYDFCVPVYHNYWMSGVFHHNTGKTFMAIAAADYFGRHEYRAIVMCPPHLCLKWEREIRTTLPAVDVYQIRSYKDVSILNPRYKSVGPEWYIVSQTRAKLGTSWKAAYRQDAHENGAILANLCCPDCQALIYTKNRDGTSEPTKPKELAKAKRYCESCGAALWQWTNEFDRWPVAHYIHKKLNGYFDFLVVDECFPAGTAVETPCGPVPIESVRPGDMVLTVKPGGKIVRRRVVRLIARRRRTRLLKITHTAGTITCTENHKFVANLRLIEASKLRIGDRLQVHGVPYGFETRKSLCDLRSSVHDQVPSATMLQSEVRSTIARNETAEKANCNVSGMRNAVYGSEEPREATDDMQYELCEKAELEGFAGEHDAWSLRRAEGHQAVRAMREGIFAYSVDCKEAEVLWEKLLQQSDLDVADYSLETLNGAGGKSREGQAGVVCANEETEQGHRVQNSPRRHQQATERKAVCRATWGERPVDAAANGLSDSARATQQHGIPDSNRDSHMAGCSCRHCDSRSQAGDRMRWGITQHQQAEKQGPQEGSHPVRSWVDGNARMELGHREATSAGSQGDPACFVSTIEAIEEVEAEEGDLVYDLEVSGTHLYFANGVLVSNCHQAKSAESAIGNASGALASSVSRVLFLSGTVFGGYAWHTKAPLFRLTPATVVSEGFTWEGDTAWNEAYGRIETKVVESDKKNHWQDYQGVWNSYSMGKTARKTKSVKPGVMPTLFGRHMIGNTVFLSLEDVADNLPELDEQVIPVEMDDEQRAAYSETEHALRDAVKSMLAKGDKRLLSQMLQTLLGYCDHPWGWGEIGYYERDDECGQGKIWQHVVTPQTLDSKVIRPKEQALIELVRKERGEGRKVWVYCSMTGKRDVSERLRQVIADAGFRVEIMRSSVPTDKREAWMTKWGPEVDVAISHPQLVETGLDFFDEKKTYNFPTVIFYH